VSTGLSDENVTTMEMIGGSTTELTVAVYEAEGGATKQKTEVSS